MKTFLTMSKNDRYLSSCKIRRVRYCPLHGLCGLIQIVCVNSDHTYPLSDETSSNYYESGDGEGSNYYESGDGEGKFVCGGLLIVF